MVLIRRQFKAAVLLVHVLSVCFLAQGLVAANAQTATDFAGTVLSVDAAAGKLAVKKTDTGTRFTFAVNEKTRFGEGLKDLADLKKGDHVTVTYSVVGSQYVAQNVVKGK
jgi:hypothetical protein